jgi:hypothetical protein
MPFQLRLRRLLHLGDKLVQRYRRCRRKLGRSDEQQSEKPGYNAFVEHGQYLWMDGSGRHKLRRSSLYMAAQDARRQETQGD